MIPAQIKFVWPQTLIEILIILAIIIVARWTLLDAARGREMFARLLAELDGKELINKE